MDNSEKFINACENGDIDVVRELIDKVDPASDDNYAIRSASLYGHIEVVKLLLADTRVDPAADNNFAIRWASRFGQTEVVKLLLGDSRVDPAAEDNWAIRWASQEGHTEIVKLLENAIKERKGIKSSSNLPHNFSSPLYDDDGNADHYKGSKSEIECFDYIKQRLSTEELIGYLRGTLIKYNHRFGKKDDAELDARKMKWYTKELHKLLEND